MTEGAKYIVVRYGDQEIPVVFPRSIEHVEMAERLRAEGSPLLGAMTVQSAGFVRIEGRMRCAGESLSLGFSADEQDDLLMDCFLEVEDQELPLRAENNELRAEVERLKDLLNPEGK